MDDNARLHLQKMIQANNVEDQTNLIRELKHSILLRKDILSLLEIKKKYGDDQNQIVQEAINECGFLFTFYTDIFNKVRKDEIDVKILFIFIEVLKKIEDGEVDQHEGSYLIGKILKEMYVDSALKKAEKLNKDTDALVEEKREPQVDIQWKKFKMMNSKQT